MPVPRLFETPAEPGAQWTHALASLLALSGPPTRAALVAELVGEELADAGTAQVRERRPLAEGGAVDLVVQDPGRAWVVGVVARLAFGGETQDALRAAAHGLPATAPRVIVLALTADRTPPAEVAALAADGVDARHKSWLRVRDWVQERPERGGAEGVDLLLLREAEYLLTPRVAELYRLEGLMPLVPAAARETFAAVYFALNDLSPAPLIETAGDRARIAFPRTGDPAVEVLLDGGALHVAIADDLAGPGYAPEARPGWSRVTLAGPRDWDTARSWTEAVARGLLPPRR